MDTPLKPITIPSRYGKNNTLVNLPKRMAKCTPDTLAAIQLLAADVKAASGGALILSDLFRSYDDQKKAHDDFVSGRKSANSPPPGGSMHEAGRAMDIELGDIKMTLKAFWPIAAKRGFFPIIDKPNDSLNEAWHFDCRGSHGLVYNYYQAGHADNLAPYKAMAVSGILALGSQARVDMFATTATEARIQSGLIRLGFDPGSIDGQLGKRAFNAIAAAGIPAADHDTMLAAIDQKLLASFPGEY
jgi:D-alanyl-D-alanine carboxypeptidase